MRDEALWRRLRDFVVDVGPGMTGFSAALAKEEGWSKDYVEEVLEEYRRFLYLSQVACGQSTPSRAIDRAWHLHLTYSRDYWERLCGEVLGQPLHHDPGSGAGDGTRFDAQYAATRALYAEEFGRPPPPTVWYPPHYALISKRAAVIFLLGIGTFVLGGFFGGEHSSSYVGAGIVIAVGSGIVMAIHADPGRRRSRTVYAGGGCGGGGE